MNNNPGYEEIRATATMDGGEGLLAVIIRSSLYGSVEGATFVTKEDSPQQIGILYHKKGKKIQPHTHRPVERTIRDTQETLIVRRGIVGVDIYTSDGYHVANRILYSNDIIVLLAGGHSLNVHQDSLIVEIKQGPYCGAEDKQSLEVKG